MERTRSKPDGGYGKGKKPSRIKTIPVLGSQGCGKTVLLQQMREPGTQEVQETGSSEFLQLQVGRSDAWNFMAYPEDSRHFFSELASIHKSKVFFLIILDLSVQKSWEIAQRLARELHSMKWKKALLGNRRKDTVAAVSAQEVTQFCQELKMNYHEADFLNQEETKGVVSQIFEKPRKERTPQSGSYKKGRRHDRDQGSEDDEDDENMDNDAQGELKSSQIQPQSTTTSATSGLSSLSTDSDLSQTLQAMVTRVTSQEEFKQQSITEIMTLKTENETLKTENEQLKQIVAALSNEMNEFKTTMLEKMTQLEEQVNGSHEKIEGVNKGWTNVGSQILSVESRVDTVEDNMGQVVDAVKDLQAKLNEG